MMRLSAAAGLFLLATTSMVAAQEAPAFDFNVITEETPAPVVQETEDGEESVGQITVSPPPGTVNVTEEIKKSAEAEEIEEAPEETLWAETPPEAAPAPSEAAKQEKQEIERETEQVEKQIKEPEQQPAAVAAPVAAPVVMPAPAPVAAPPVISVVPVPQPTTSATPQNWQSPAAARTTSPYERSRVVPRIKLDGNLPQPKIGAPFTALDTPAAPIPPAPMPRPAPNPPVMAQVAAPVAAPAPMPVPPAESVAEAAPVITATQPAIESALPATPASASAILAFEGDKSALTSDMLMQIDTLIAQMMQNPALRLQVRAFAAGSDGSEMSAKRVALSRVLAVRSYVLEKGIAPLRIDVRPLGLENGGTGNPDRIELEFID